MQVRKAYLKVITLVKEFGFCPACWDKGKLSRSGLDSFHCSNCNYTTTFDKNEAIFEYYEIICGDRILKSYKISMSSPQWKRMLVAIRELKRKKYR